MGVGRQALQQKGMHLANRTGIDRVIIVEDNNSY